jgi:hypothetical protein
MKTITFPVETASLNNRATNNNYQNPLTIETSNCDILCHHFIPLLSRKKRKLSAYTQFDRAHNIMYGNSNSSCEKSLLLLQMLQLTSLHFHVLFSPVICMEISLANCYVLDRLETLVYTSTAQVRVITAVAASR